MSVTHAHSNVSCGEGTHRPVCRAAVTALMWRLLDVTGGEMNHLLHPKIFLFKSRIYSPEHQIVSMHFLAHNPLRLQAGSLFFGV